MVRPLMRKATALWLINNTALTFQQISDFCGLLLIEIEVIADEETSSIQEINPVANGQLTKEEIERCTSDPSAKLAIQASNDRPYDEGGKKYIPLAKRKGRNEGVLWLLKNCPELGASQISTLLCVTKYTIAAIQNGTHWNIKNLVPQSPVLSGLCTQEDLDVILINKDTHDFEKAQKARD